MIINRCKLSSSKPKNQVVETLGSNPVPGAIKNPLALLAVFLFLRLS